MNLTRAAVRPAPASVSQRDRSLARVAAWTIEQGVAVDEMVETIRRAVVVALLESRSPGLDHPELADLTPVPGDIAEDLGRAFRDVEIGELAQRLLEWEVRDASSDIREIPLAETGLPLVLAPAQTARRNRGAYFTPVPLVQALVQRALAPWQDDPAALSTLTILDPACGDGRFLVEVARQIWLRLEGPGSPDPTLRRRVIDRCLFGIDNDPLCVCQARAALWQAAGLPGEPPEGLLAHLVTADGLLDETPGEESRFDLVIGNPPFGSFSGRGALPLDPLLKQRYLEAWGGSGWETLHGMFLKRALELANHTLALVLPTQVTHLEGYAELRTAVTDSMSLHEVEDHGEAVFRGEAVAPVVTLIARRDRAGAASWVETKLPEWVRGVRSRGESLGRLVGDPGVHTGNCARRLVVDIDDGEFDDGDCVGVLEGRQVHRYRCEPPARKLRLDYEAGEGEYFTIRPLNTYRRARFVIRQTARFPIVGPKHTTEYFRNSLLALFEPDNGYDIRYLVGLLNSRLLRYLYTTAVRESKQASFPQVKVGSLRDLPIIWPDLDDLQQRGAYEAIVAGVGRLLELHRVVDCLTHFGGDDSPPSQEFLQLEEHIDECVMLIYGLDQAAREDVYSSERGR
jgi:hypothetical protein